jgi:RecG-like helicase
LSDREVNIKSPDYIEDKVTGEKREVDISIRGNVGSHQILIIIEVRDRSKRQDVTWIEQLATKRDDVGANKAIAVSTYGFSKGAERKAELKNIELRTIEQITKESIQNWFKVTSITNLHRYFNILKVQLHPKNQEYKEKLSEYFAEKKDLLNLEEKILICEGIENQVSLNDIFKLIKELDEFYKDLQPGNKKFIHIRVAQENQIDYKLITKSDPILIDFIDFDAQLWIEITYAPILSIREYKTSEKNHAQVITFEDIEISGEKHSVQLLSIPHGDLKKIGFKLTKKK